jgi:catechol 2,3-dioxygenase-like lactoylglutathione lyase family enzyme
MINANIIGFVATQNPASARKFYEEILGLAFVSDDPFAIVFNVNGTMLRVQKVQQFLPAQHTVLGWKVSDMRAQVQKLKESGVRFERFDGLSQDELGIWTSPAGAKVAWFKDPDGNMLSLTQFQ